MYVKWIFAFLMPPVGCALAGGQVGQIFLDTVLWALGGIFGIVYAVWMCNKKDVEDTRKKVKAEQTGEVINTKDSNKLLAQGVFVAIGSMIVVFAIEAVLFFAVIGFCTLVFGYPIVEKILKEHGIITASLVVYKEISGAINTFL